MRDALELVRRDVLLCNPGRYGIADEQLHFPYLYESARGHWYMTYREGPHLEERFGPGNRVQCVQSRDGGRSWLPWMGLAPEQWLYQLFISRLRDGSLISYRCRMEQLQGQADGRLEGMTIILRSRDEGALLHESVKGAFFPCCCRSGGDLDFIGFRFAQMDHSIEHATTDPGFDLLSSPTSSPEPRGEYPLKPEDAGFGQRSSMIATVFFHRFRPFFPMACTRWLRASICRYRRLAFRACALRRGGITDSIGLF